MVLPFCCLHSAFYSVSLKIFLHHLLDFIPLDFDLFCLGFLHCRWVLFGHGWILCSTKSSYCPFKIRIVPAINVRISLRAGRKWMPCSWALESNLRMCWAFCISSKEIRIFLNEEMWREVPLGCLGSRLSWFPRGNLCLVREIPSFRATTSHLRRHDKQANPTDPK